MRNAYDLWAEMIQKPEIWEEKAKTDFSSELYQHMQENDVSRVELARKIDVTKPYISKILAGSANFTIKTMAKLAFALGYRLDISMKPLKEHIMASRWIPTYCSVSQLGPVVWKSARDFNRSDTTELGRANCASQMIDDIAA